MKRVLHSLTLLALFAALPHWGRAQDWPQWRGPARDGVAASFTAPKAWPAELKLLWRVHVGEGHSSPVVVGNRVYIFTRQKDREILSALDLRSGKILWQDTYEAPFEMARAARAHGKGPKSTPAAAGERLCTLGISGVLSCYDTAAGRLRWRKEFSEEFAATWPLYGAAMSPVMDRGGVIVHVGGHGNGALIAFDLETGEERWRWTDDGPGYASPLVVELGGTRQVVTQSQEHVVGISAADGALLWKIPFSTDYTQNIVTPLVYRDTLIFSGLNQSVFAVRVARREGAWTAATIWENREVPMYMSSPVLAGSVLVGMTHRNRGQFFCLDPATGKTLWRGEPRQADNASLVVAGEQVLMVTDAGELIVSRVGQQGLAEMRRYPVADSPVWAHAVPAGQRILVKDATALALWSLE